MKKEAKSTINNSDPRTSMTMPYLGKGSEIKHRKKGSRLIFL